MALVVSVDRENCWAVLAAGVDKFQTDTDVVLCIAVSNILNYHVVQTGGLSRKAACWSPMRALPHFLTCSPGRRWRACHQRLPGVASIIAHGILTQFLRTVAPSLIEFLRVDCQFHHRLLVAVY